MSMDPKFPIGKATDTPPTDEAEVEGHGLKLPVTGQPADDETPDAEVEGHMPRVRAISPPPAETGDLRTGKFGPYTELPPDDPEAEVEGHMPRVGRMRAPQAETGDDQPDVQGHGGKLPYTEQPAEDPEAEVEGHGRPRGG